MRSSIRRLSLLIIVLTVCVAIVGAGYGHWSESLTIDGQGCVFGELCYEWVEQEVNDYPGHPGGPVPGADETIGDGFTEPRFFLDKDVGWNECFLIDTDGDGLRDTIEFRVHNAYPSYFGKVVGTLWNCSDVPILIDAVYVTYPQYPGDPYGPYDWVSYQGSETPPPPPPIVNAPPFPHPPEFEVQWMNGAWTLPIVVPAKGSKLFGAGVHILQPAAQGAEYVFRVSIRVSAAT